MVAFLPVQDEDFGELVRTSKLSFENDVEYGAPAPEGPFGYDSITWFRRAELYGSRLYKIVDDEKIIGGIVLEPDTRHAKVWYLSRLWLAPEWQNRGVGTKAEAFIENAVPAARVWKLETPAYNERNQHFYEKLGFKRVGIHCGMVRYDKDLRANRNANVFRGGADLVAQLLQSPQVFANPLSLALDHLPGVAAE